MSCDDLLIIKGSEVLSLLEGQETELIRLVRMAYEAHAYGQSSLPQSIFLRFPNDHLNRIIALPAYLGREFNIAGMKWVSSFPGNLEKGIERASAAIILNSSLTGRPEAFIEGSIISAKRTAASAALAAQYLQVEKSIKRVGLVGGGLINFEIARFLLAVFPDITSFMLFDKDLARAHQFGSRCRE
jgi:ornithine cyclodeaminase